MNNRSYKKIAEDNLKEVQSWPKWKQNIVISSEAARTGIYDKDKLEKYLKKESMKKNETLP